MTAKEALENANLKGSKSYEVLLKALTSYEELKRDVKRYFELQYKNQFDRMTQNEIHDMYVLREKLSKVGNEE